MVDKERKYLQKAKQLLSEYFKKVDSIERISGGVTHYVYRFYSGNKSYILKLRGQHFSNLDHIACNPEDIIVEAKALQIFNFYLPDIFPEVLYCDEKNGLLITSDLLPQGGEVLRETFNHNPNIQKDLVVKIAKLLTRIQSDLENITIPLRSNLEAEKDYFEYLLRLRFHFQNASTTEKYIQKHLNYSSKQLIYGAFAMKNFLINEKNELKLCDLETACLGTKEFDFGFCLAHILLHSMSSVDQLKNNLEVFLKTYGEKSASDLNEELVVSSIIGSFMYRLDPLSKKAPYKTSLSENSTKKLFIELNLFIDQEELSLNKLLKVLEKSLK